MEVPAQEAGQSAGEDEAEESHVWLDRVGRRLITPRVTAAIRAMPVESPSRPSMKLMLLIMPTIQSSVATAATASEMWRVALERQRIVDAGDDHSKGEGEAGQQELAQELPAGAELEPVVEEAEAHRQHRATEQCQDLRPLDDLRLVDEVHADDGVGEDEKDRHEHEPEQDGDTAAASYGLLVHPPSLGPIDHSEATGIVPDDRRRRQGDRPRQEEPEDQGRERLDGLTVQAHGAVSAADR